MQAAASMIATMKRYPAKKNFSEMTVEEIQEHGRKEREAKEVQGETREP